MKARPKQKEKKELGGKLRHHIKENKTYENLTIINSFREIRTAFTLY